MGRSGPGDDDIEFLDVDPTSRASAAVVERQRPRGPLIAGGVALLLVVLVAVLMPGAQDPEPEPPTPPATTLLPPGVGGFALDRTSGTFTLPAGWISVGGWGVIKAADEPAFGVTFFEVGHVYADPCAITQRSPRVGPAVDDLVDALTSATHLRPTAASDVTIDGHRGRRLELTVPDYDQQERCRNRRFYLWRDDGGRYWAQGPGEHHQVSILDVRGATLLINVAWFDDATPRDRADLAAIVRSLRID